MCSDDLGGADYIALRYHGMVQELQEIYMPLDKYSIALIMKTVLREVGQLHVISVRFYYSSKHITV